VCPITGLRATAEYLWRVDGEHYVFCCQPCIDEFVTLAKDRPTDVRRAVEYVKRQ
jgi:YHS domain-containing protein